MAGKNKPGISWRHTSVIVRADIFSKAHEQGIDISDICNKALAELLGVDYCQQRLDDVPVPQPVIIAGNGPRPEGTVPAKEARPAGHSMVINADDPAASATVRTAKREPKSSPVPKEPEPVTTRPRKKEEAVLSPAADAAPAGMAQKPAAVKTPKDNGMKKFVSTRITRSDADDAVCSKDDMYQAFVRFCREHKIAPVPDRKSFTIALKNKFAFFDKTVNSTPCWVNVRLK
jgi:hypothetical protein